MYTPDDTDPEVRRLQFEIWRSMTPTERFLLADRLSDDLIAVTVVGVRAQVPDATDEELHRELVRRRYGLDLDDGKYSKPGNPVRIR